MKTFLDRVRRQKLGEIEKRKEKFSENVLIKKLEESIKIPEFKKNLLRHYGDEISLILEVKSRSPAGKKNIDFLDPEKIVCDYELGGAKAISVLTDEKFFPGKTDYIKMVKNVVKLPIIRKDFIIDPIQVYQSKIIGADCILLIMACLSDTQLKDLYDLAISLNLEVLIEIHNLKELKRVLNVVTY